MRFARNKKEIRPAKFRVSRLSTVIKWDDFHTRKGEVEPKGISPAFMPVLFRVHVHYCTPAHPSIKEGWCLYIPHP